MGSLFSSTKNTRRLVEGSSRFIRSDVPTSLTAEEIKWLVDEDVVTVIDLREESEQQAKPCPLKDDKRFDYHSLPVTGGNAVPKRPEDVAASYIAMCDDKMELILDMMIQSYSNVLFFCNAGKDRTGVVSAIILDALGYDEEYIVRDYLQSGENLRDELTAYAKSCPDINIDVITPHREYITDFLRLYKGR